jgi:hypothetical protein
VDGERVIRARVTTFHVGVKRRNVRNEILFVVLLWYAKDLNAAIHPLGCPPERDAVGVGRHG